jgi:hypothetical protein
MEKFKYQTLRNLQNNHLDILRANSTNVAYSCEHGNNYIAAAKPHDMSELKSKLFPKKNQGPGPNHAYSTASLRSNNQ